MKGGQCIRQLVENYTAMPSDGLHGIMSFCNTIVLYKVDIWISCKNLYVHLQLEFLCISYDDTHLWLESGVQVLRLQNLAIQSSVKKDTYDVNVYLIKICAWKYQWYRYQIKLLKDMIIEVFSLFHVLRWPLGSLNVSSMMLIIVNTFWLAEQYIYLSDLICPWWIKWWNRGGNWKP